MPRIQKKTETSRRVPLPPVSPPPLPVACATRWSAWSPPADAVSRHTTETLRAAAAACCPLLVRPCPCHRRLLIHPCRCRHPSTPLKPCPPPPPPLPATCTPCGSASARAAAACWSPAAGAVPRPPPPPPPMHKQKQKKKDGDPGRVVAARRCCCVAPKSLSVRGLITLGALVCRTV